ncbi:MAG: C40 family peptidase, partial [Spirochaetes bacterium]|nr:C40 family peptidase [Spirochaetota bacterium]
MSGRTRQISLFILFLFISSCAPPAHMYRKGRIFEQDRREKIVRTAEKYVGIKYRYGGTTLFGFDCSGFVQFIYAKHGLEIPRGSDEQYDSARKISIRNAVPGDLVFFRINGSGVSHVGIYIGNNRFIHSPRSGKKITY